MPEALRAPGLSQLDTEDRLEFSRLSRVLETAPAAIVTTSQFVAMFLQSCLLKFHDYGIEMCEEVS